VSPRLLFRLLFTNNAFSIFAFHTKVQISLDFISIHSICAACFRPVPPVPPVLRIRPSSCSIFPGGSELCTTCIQYVYLKCSQAATEHGKRVAGGVAGKVRENSHSQLMSFEAEPLPMAMSSGRCGCGCGWVDLKATFNCIRNCSS